MILVTQLGVSTLMVAASIIVHLTGLLMLLRLIDRRTPAGPNRSSRLTDIVRVMSAALGLFLLHTIEIWAYAITYVSLGALERLDDALYFSTSAYVATGYGDVIVDRSWRVTGAIEGANGVILLGWSTAFLVSVVGRLRILERSWKHEDDVHTAERDDGALRLPGTRG